MSDRGTILEALHEAAEQYGVRWSVGDQVAVGRDIAALPKVTRDGVNAAVVGRGLTAPKGFGSEVARLVKRWS